MLQSNRDSIRKYYGIIIECQQYLGLLVDFEERGIASPVIAFPLHNPVVKMTPNNFVSNINWIKNIKQCHSSKSKQSGYDKVNYLPKDGPWKPIKELFTKDTIKTHSIDINSVSPTSYGSTIFDSLDFANLTPMKKKIHQKDLLLLGIITQEEFNKFVPSKEKISQQLENIQPKEFDSSLVYVKDWLFSRVNNNKKTSSRVASRQPTKRKAKTESGDDVSPTKRTRSEQSPNSSDEKRFIFSTPDIGQIDLNASISDIICTNKAISSSNSILDGNSKEIGTNQTKKDEIQARPNSFLPSSSGLASSSSSSQESDRISTIEEISDEEECDDEAQFIGKRKKQKGTSKQFTADQYPLIRDQIREAGSRIIAHKEVFGNKASPDDAVNACATSIDEELCNGQLDNVFLTIIEKYITTRVKSGETVVSHEIKNVTAGRFDPHTCMISPYKANKDGKVKCVYASKGYNVPRLFAHLMYNEPGRSYPSQPLAYLDCSHVRCNNPSCFNPWHVVFEPRDVNLDRKKCHARERECIHELKCGLDGRDILVIKKEQD